MDYMLDIIILKRELNKSGLSEILREWEGVKCSISPALYVTESDIEFIEISDMSYYSYIIGVDFMQDVIGMHLKSDVLYDFEYSANRKSDEVKDDKLLIFLKNLFKLSLFYILLIRDMRFPHPKRLNPYY